MRSDGTKTAVIGNPIRLSATLVAYRRGAPRLGENAAEVPGEWLGAGEEEIEQPRAAGAFGR
ncbi:MAG: hypothetical protein IT529_13280 [Burkholderiales bacterium]|nr:hypothetical protein [Burkholderiales bacterium]